MVVVRDFGYALLYVGFGIAVAAMVFSVPIATRSLWRLRPIGALQVLVPSPPSATASIGGAMPVGLLLPAVHGTALDGSEITLIGFSGLEPALVRSRGQRGDQHEQSRGKTKTEHRRHRAANSADDVAHAIEQGIQIDQRQVRIVVSQCG